MSSSTLPSQSVPIIETRRLLMRGYRPDDYAAYLAMWQHPDYYRYLSPKPLPAEEVWKMLLRSAGHWALMGYGFWAVEEKATGQFIGTVGFADLKRNIEPPIGDAPEIGWVLAPNVHGRGYASEAVHAAIAWGMEHFGPVRTVCIIHPDNEPSLRVATKFGYREYARTTYNGDPIVMLERPQLTAVV
ncbi:GNAT family N-acetyltransferase [Hymenobacter sp. BT664]|uniref:GNAT family N-acetyltransferase n=1 Tax=Hymenobacter montanus TaxID=2771359 RepID=A0A927BFX7_9BACT|nr:GNAT family N-acetyltransferase [Hymenobacter montanus]MBD2770150.1 GNAT family N-acetyltransferase [Hymenobacter montanus]